MIFFKKFLLNKQGLFFMFLTTFIFFIIFILINMFNLYQYDLKKELLSKEAHIYLLYSKPLPKDSKIIDQIHSILKDEKYRLKFFLSKKLFLRIEAGDSFAGVSLDSKAYVFGIDGSEILNTKSLTLYDKNIDISKKNSCNIILNKVLNSMFNNKNFLTTATVITSKKTNTTLVGYYEDYGNKPILYTNISCAKKILSDTTKNISGYMIKFEDIDKIDEYMKIFREKFKDNNIKITDTLQTNKQQMQIVKMLEKMVFLFVSIIFIMAVFVNILWLYGIILDKQPQIRILYNLGIDIQNKLILYICISFVVFAFIGFKISDFIYSYHNPFEAYKLFCIFITLLIVIFWVFAKKIFLIKQRIK